MNLRPRRGRSRALRKRIVASDSVLEIPVEIAFENHRDKDGVCMSWRSVASNDMTGRMITDVTSVETNPDVDAKLFELP